MKNLTKILIGDEVALIEAWTNSDGIMELDTTTEDCRFTGYCRDIKDDCILASCEKDDDMEYCLEFKIYKDGMVMKQSESYAIHIDDSFKLFPIKK